MKLLITILSNSYLIFATNRLLLLETEIENQKALLDTDKIDAAASVSQNQVSVATGPGSRFPGNGRAISISDLTLLQNYGCWCALSVKSAHRGAPVDFFDRACKRLKKVTTVLN